MSKKRNAESAWGVEQFYEQQPPQSYEEICQPDRPDKVQKGAAPLVHTSIGTEMWGQAGQYVRKCLVEEYSIIS
jgi:hypothetical protein